MKKERIEKNLNINPNKNNYYSGKNASINVFNLKSLMDDVFGDYISKYAKLYSNSILSFI